MPDPVQEFRETLILQQGILHAIDLNLPKIALRFMFPKWFEIQFNRVEDYRIKLGLAGRTTIRAWSATRASELLRALPDRRRNLSLPPLRDRSHLCHFHLTFPDGYLDVVAEDYVFIMVSK